MKLHSNTFAQPLFTDEMNRPRGTLALIVLQTMEYGNGSTEMIQYAFDDAGKIQSKETIPVNSRDIFACVPVENYLYIFGMEYTSNSNFTMRYDACANVWIQLAPLLQPPRAGVAAAYAQGQIYLMGGRDLGCRETTSLCDRYLIADNRWDITQNMPYQVGRSEAILIGFC